MDAAELLPDHGWSCGATDRRSVGSAGSAVAEHMSACYVDLAPRISEERSQPSPYEWERLLAHGTVGAEVHVRHDQEQMMGSRADMCLPDVLQVVVVRRGPASLDLREHATLWTERIEEVRPRPCDQPVLWREDDLLSEVELVAE